MNGVVNGVCLPLVGIPFLGWLRETLRTESDGLVVDCSVRIGEDLEQDGSNGVFTGIATDNPG